MDEIAYELVDVFTEHAFGGNPLAVCLDGRDLDDASMQRIAKEFNLSETTFVLPPEDADNDFRVRIFTPVAELPMAGHPTIGTAWTLAMRGAIAAGRRRVVFEEGVGPVPVEIAWRDSQPARCTMQQPLPTFGPAFADRDALASMLSIAPGALAGPGLVVSCGVPYLIVELPDLASVKAVRLRSDVMERELRGFAASAILVFTRECETPRGDAHMRMFAPSDGVFEDPATGSAAGPLGCHLARSAGLGNRALVFEQGFEMGRPSFLYVEIDARDEAIERVRVGGDCVWMGSGVLSPGGARR